MAKLLCKTSGTEFRAAELKPGVNRLGRSPENDLHLNHLSVSSNHCEIILDCSRVSVRDCGSTNGTFLDGNPVREAVLLAGQTLRVGEVELLVVDTQPSVTIPRFDCRIGAVPALLPHGGLSCRHHRGNELVYSCQHCGELLCEHCIHLLRRRGGKLLRLCPRCSYPVELIGGQKQVKKSFLKRLFETTRMFFSHRTTRN
ncbi:MAG TPA: FHA domain-containing protein [Verrucomicrobiae bacterium]|nr:FHA domain-containing protein [Verrucomicrobiae bacterium]